MHNRVSIFRTHREYHQLQFPLMLIGMTFSKDQFPGFVGTMAEQCLIFIPGVPCGQPLCSIKTQLYKIIPSLRTLQVPKICFAKLCHCEGNKKERKGGEKYSHFDVISYPWINRALKQLTGYRWTDTTQLRNGQYDTVISSSNNQAHTHQIYVDMVNIAISICPPSHKGRRLEGPRHPIRLIANCYQPHKHVCDATTIMAYGRCWQINLISNTKNSVFQTRW